MPGARLKGEEGCYGRCAGWFMAGCLNFVFKAEEQFLDDGVCAAVRANGKKRFVRR